MWDGGKVTWDGRAKDGEGSGTPTEPHPTPSPEATSSQHTTSSIRLPSFTTSPIPIPTVTQTDTTPIIQYSRRARIAQSSALPTVADEPASPVRDDSQREACPTDSGFIADQDRATISKSSTLPRDSTPRVTSPAAEEGRTAGVRVLCLGGKSGATIAKSSTLPHDSAPRVTSPVADEGSSGGRDSQVEGKGEAATERISDDTEEMATVLTSIDAATVLAGGIDDVPTSSGSIPTAGPPAADIPTGSKEVMVESDTLKKQRLEEQIDAQVARELEEQQEKEDKRISKQITRYAEVARIHAKEELQSMIDGLDRNNETIGKVDHESSKKLKSSEEVIEEAKSTDEIPKEKIKEMMQLIPIEEVYVEAIQVKHLIIDWKVYKEGHRSYWKIIRLGRSLACYQFFVDLLKNLDREDLNQLWILVKEYLNIRPASSDKEMELWVELKRLYEPDPEDQLWTQTQNFMHVPIE
nr:hypothetical protein [Tanacetum cinerariifolium]